MSGYVEAGYAVAFLTLSGYAVSLVVRERAAARRLGPAAPGHEPEGTDGGLATQTRPE